MCVFIMYSLYPKNNVQQQNCNSDDVISIEDNEREVDYPKVSEENLPNEFSEETKNFKETENNSSGISEETSKLEQGIRLPDDNWE